MAFDQGRFWLTAADYTRASEGLDGGEGADDGVLGGHAAGAESETGGDDSGETLRNGGDGQSDGDLEVVDSTLDPWPAVGGVVEVSNVDSPDSNANNGNDLQRGNWH